MPPRTAACAYPSHALKQLTLPLEDMPAWSAAGDVMVAGAVAVHPFASVMVTI